MVGMAAFHRPKQSTFADIVSFSAQLPTIFTIELALPHPQTEAEVFCCKTMWSANMEGNAMGV